MKNMEEKNKTELVLERISDKVKELMGILTRNIDLEDNGIIMNDFLPIVECIV